MIITPEDLAEVIIVAENSLDGRCNRRLEILPDYQHFLAGLISSYYLRPHRHNHQVEYFRVHAGIVQLHYFDDAGEITNSTLIGPQQVSLVPINTWHTLAVISDAAALDVYFSGSKKTKEVAPWAPPGPNYTAAAIQYLQHLKHA